MDFAVEAYFWENRKETKMTSQGQNSMNCFGNANNMYSRVKKWNQHTSVNKVYCSY